MNIPLIDKRSLTHSIIDCNPFEIVDIGCGPAPFFIDAINIDIKTPHDWMNKIERQVKEGAIPLEFYEMHKKVFKNMLCNYFVKADARHLPFKTKVFRYAIMSELLEHMEHPEQVIMEAQRVATTIIIIVPNEYQWSEDKKPFQHPDHYTYFTEETLLALAEKTGLRYPELIKIRFEGWCHFVLIALSQEFPKI